MFTHSPQPSSFISSIFLFLSFYLCKNIQKIASCFFKENEDCMQSQPDTKGGENVDENWMLFCDEIFNTNEVIGNMKEIWKLWQFFRVSFCVLCCATFKLHKTFLHCRTEAHEKWTKESAKKFYYDDGSFFIVRLTQFRINVDWILDESWEFIRKKNFIADDSTRSTEQWRKI